MHRNGLRHVQCSGNFSTLVNTVLAGVANCNTYLDDLIVYSPSWSTHVNSFREVFDRLAGASLTLNLAKCEFREAIVTYLGRQVGQGQVWPVEEKVKAITIFPVPTNRRELCWFPGMSGCY